jgi:hypothetical protein
MGVRSAQKKKSVVNQNLNEAQPEQPTVHTVIACEENEGTSQHW